MKVLIRHKKTGLFLGRQGQWVPEGEAWELKGISEAGEEAWRHEGAEMIIVPDDDNPASAWEVARMDAIPATPRRR